MTVVRGTHAAAALLVALVTGCAAQPSGGAVNPSNDPRAILAGRSTSAEAVARYEQMQQRIRNALDATIGPRPWRQNHSGDTGGCSGTWTGSGGRSVHLDPWLFPGAIPNARWQQARAIVLRAAAGYGFTHMLMETDQPGFHLVSLQDPGLDALFEFGTQVDTVMQVSTGCHRAP